MLFWRKQRSLIKYVLYIFDSTVFKIDDGPLVRACIWRNGTIKYFVNFPIDLSNSAHIVYSVKFPTVSNIVAQLHMEFTLFLSN
jgi:hypothetical protein